MVTRDEHYVLRTTGNGNWQILAPFQSDTLDNENLCTCSVVVNQKCQQKLTHALDNTPMATCQHVIISAQPGRISRDKVQGILFTFVYSLCSCCYVLISSAGPHPLAEQGIFRSSLPNTGLSFIHWTVTLYLSNPKNQTKQNAQLSRHSFHHRRCRAGVSRLHEVRGKMPALNILQRASANRSQTGYPGQKLQPLAVHQLRR